MRVYGVYHNKSLNCMARRNDDRNVFKRLSNVAS